MAKIRLANHKIEQLIIGINERNNYSSKILKQLNITYSHGTKLFGILEDNKIIKKTKSGSKMYIKLTEKGEKIKFHLQEIKNTL
jgi:predicted transcriptional regulator